MYVFYSVMFIYLLLFLGLLIYVKKQKSQEVRIIDELNEQINQLINENLDIQQKKESLLQEKNNLLQEKEGLLQEIDSLQKNILAYQNHHIIDDIMCSFEQYTADNPYFLEGKFQNLYNSLVFGNHREIENGLLEYSKSLMYLALHRGEYQKLISSMSFISFNDVIQECQLMDINQNGLKKQILWLIFVLKRSPNSSDALAQIQDFISKINDVNNQRLLWESLQKTEPKIVLRIQKGVAYVL